MFKHVLFSPRNLGKWSNLTSTFFKWVVQWFNHKLVDVPVFWPSNQQNQPKTSWIKICIVRLKYNKFPCKLSPPKTRLAETHVPRSKLPLFQELTHPPAVPGKRVWVGVGLLLLLLLLLLLMLMLMLLLLLHGVLLAQTRAARARAPNKPPNTDSFGARARAARARTYMERRFGSPQTKPKPWYIRCFCSKRENKNWT